jgi:hypothetical protein
MYFITKRDLAAVKSLRTAAVTVQDIFKNYICCYIIEIIAVTDLGDVVKPEVIRVHDRP